MILQLIKQASLKKFIITVISPVNYIFILVLIFYQGKINKTPYMIHGVLSLKKGTAMNN